ncbi:hypothetical protein GCM10022214_30590 [Actinomadura miaoliensis]|uniref:Peptidase S33 tripeptidyl aminopeptidase-like C-terminal domain-containing protein n=2 Tax=Actinomadura miaoliensis TaxID=430685 RepID=A0ABP7VQZ0_9ACTN
MTNSRHDFVTTYRAATNVARQIPTATLLTYDGVAHVTYLNDPCSRTAIERNLRTLRTPPHGTHCPPAPAVTTAEPPPARQ